MKKFFHRLMLLDEPKEIPWFFVQLMGLSFVVGSAGPSRALDRAT
jgi:hypothetical protein